jgi:hypothetical protein
LRYLFLSLSSLSCPFSTSSYTILAFHIALSTDLFL